MIVRAQPERRGSSTDISNRAPIVILGCAQSGAQQLQRLLTRDTAIACTVSSGILPLCDHAATTWQEVEGRESLSALAAASIRAMADSLITAVLASAGGYRWCEVSFASAERAATFRTLYPATRFLCVHRRCADVIAAALHAHPWGLAGSPFSPYAIPYPGDSIAAIAAYWAASTQALLQFAESHPAACHQIRYEDLTAAETVSDDVAAFLGLGSGAVTPTRPRSAGAPGAAAPESATHGRSFPAGRLPHALSERIVALETRIGYPAVAMPGLPAGSGTGAGEVVSSA